MSLGVPELNPDSGENITILRVTLLSSPVSSTYRTVRSRQHAANTRSLFSSVAILQSVNNLSILTFWIPWLNLNFLNRTWIIFFFIEFIDVENNANSFYSYSSYSTPHPHPHPLHLILILILILYTSSSSSTPHPHPLHLILILYTSYSSSTPHSNLLHLILILSTSFISSTPHPHLSTPHSNLLHLILILIPYTSF